MDELPTSSNPTPAVLAMTPEKSTQILASGAVRLENAKYAGFGTRLSASLIDGFIAVLPTWILYIISLTGILMPVSVYYVFNPFLISILYNTFAIALTQTTVGKSIFGLRVVNASGKDVSFGTAFMREVVGKILSSISLVGYLMVLFTEKKQGLHDIIAGTYVMDMTPNAKGKKLLMFLIPVLSVLVTIGFIFLLVTVVFNKVNTAIIKPASETLNTVQKTTSYPTTVPTRSPYQSTLKPTAPPFVPPPPVLPKK